MTRPATVRETREVREAANRAGGVDAILDRAVLRVRCSACRERFAAVGYVEGRAMVAHRWRGVRRHRSTKLPRAWRAGWLDLGNVVQGDCRCGRHVVSTADLRAMLPGPTEATREVLDTPRGTA